MTKKMKYGVVAVLLMAVMITGVPCGTVKAFAEADVEVSDAATTAAATDTATAAGTEAAAETVTPGTIQTNNGMFLANTFPDSMMPAGFHKQTVTYQSQSIDLAYMDNGNGLVVLAYLTDQAGANGDFYLCDTATATMTDFVMISGGSSNFMIVLDPGDNILPPDGFTKATLNWDNKSVTAWKLPDGSTGSSSEASSETSSLGMVNVYAADINAGAGAVATSAGAGETEGSQAAEVPAATDAQTAAAADTQAADTQAATEEAAVETDASGFIKAQPSDFFLVYGIDQNGTQGFFLYDTVGKTYQRYVQIDTGESAETEGYRKSAQTRLFIIAGLIIFAVVLIFIIINMALGGRKNNDYDDDDDDVEEMKRRVRKKERSSIKHGRRQRNRILDRDDDEDDEYDDEDEDDEDDEEDEDEDDEDEDEEYEDEDDVPVEKNRAENDIDWTKMEISLKPKKRVQEEEEPVRSRRTQKSADLDEDFDFDFIDPKDR